jgi:small subunit ribosomal protein S16
MRVGKRKQPSYRVVVADRRSPRDGRIIEAIGHYQPRKDPSEIQIDSDRAVYWLRNGAQPSNTVRKLLEITGVWSSFTGEAPPTAVTPAREVKATPAASIEEEGSPEPEAGEANGTVPDAAGAAPGGAVEDSEK